MMGDNRYCSKDSRYWGVVPRDERPRPAAVRVLLVRPGPGHDDEPCNGQIERSAVPFITDIRWSTHRTLGEVTLTLAHRERGRHREACPPSPAARSSRRSPPRCRSPSSFDAHTPRPSFISQATRPRSTRSPKSCFHPPRSVSAGVDESSRGVS